MIGERKTIFSNIQDVRALLTPDYKRRLWFCLLLLLLNSILELIGLAAILPYFSVMLSDDGVTGSRFLNSILLKTELSVSSFLIVMAVLLFGIVVVKNFFSTLIIKYQSRFTFSLYQYLSKRLHQYHYSKGLLHFKRMNSNFLVNYINNVPSLFAQYFLFPLLTLLNEIIVIILLLVGVIAVNPQIVLLLLITVVPLSVGTYLMVRRKIQGIGRKKNEYSAQVVKSIRQSIDGYVDAETLGRAAYFERQFHGCLHESAKLHVKSSVWNAVPTKIIEAGMVLGIIVLMFYGLYFRNEAQSFGTLIGLFGLIGYRVLPSVNRVMASLISIKEHQYTVDFLVETKENSNSVKNVPDASPLTFENFIEIKDLSYSYDNVSVVLKNLSVEIKKGDVLGVIGRSGSGKSTLIQILLRFMKESSGYIAVDGTRVNEHNVRAWRSLIGYVQQDVYIIDGTFAENIAFGVPLKEIDNERLEKVIDVASLRNVVEQWPAGVDTNLGEMGGLISGGQRQRVGIARALYAEAKILLFDEATSALDTETEYEITEAIQKLSMNNVTMVIVAHRLSTLKYCTKVVELADGRIVRTGSYLDMVDTASEHG